MVAGERELRTFFTSQLGPGETLLACAYGIEQESRAKGLARFLGASAGSWIGGALEADSGWGFATTSTRLLIVRARRVQRLLRGPKLVFDRLRSYTAPSELGARIESRDLEVLLKLRLDGRARSIRFSAIAGFPDNLRQANEISDWLVDQGW